MEKDPKKWKTIGACILAALLLAVCIGAYAHYHPGSLLAYILFKSGIRTFDPSFAAKQEGVVLFSDLKSYSSIAEVTNQFGSKGLTVALRFEQEVGFPTKGVSHWQVKPCSDLKQAGDLLLIFLNDRLASTSFFPYQPDRYYEALVKQKGIDFSKTGEVYLKPYVKVKRALNRDMNPSVSWSDERLEEQRLQWAMRHPNLYKNLTKFKE
jgi:hypothetical protein